MNNPTDPSATTRSRVAILVVHGVAAKTSLASLDQVTDMLSSYQPEDATYSSAEKTAFTLSVNGDQVRNLVKNDPSLGCDQKATRERLENYWDIASPVAKELDELIKLSNPDVKP